MKRIYLFIFICFCTLLASCSNDVEFTREMAIQDAIEKFQSASPNVRIFMSAKPHKNVEISYKTRNGEDAKKTTPSSRCWIAGVVSDASYNNCIKTILVYDVRSGLVDSIESYRFKLDNLKNKDFTIVYDPNPEAVDNRLGLSD